MLKRLVKNIDENMCNRFVDSVFDANNFFKPWEFECECHPLFFYMVDDNDLCYMFKWLGHETDEYRCIFSREHHVSMWKSYAEYYNIFKYTPFNIEEQKDIVMRQVEKLCHKYDYNSKVFFTVDSSYKEGYIHPNKTYIEIDGVTKTISDVSDDFNFPRFAKEFFYLYLTKDITQDHKDELMEMIERNI
jgi:hypothetical protein